MDIKIVQMVDVSDLDKLVIETYKRPYSFQQQEGCKFRGVETFLVPDGADDFENETVPEIINHEEMGVSFAAWLDRDPEKPLSDKDEDMSRSLWWERNFYPAPQMVLNDLHEKGLLPGGKLVVNIDW